MVTHDQEKSTQILISGGAYRTGPLMMLAGRILQAEDYSTSLLSDHPVEEQQIVAEFVNEYDLHTSTEFRLLDLVEEIGEIAEDAVEAAEYGDSPDEVDVSSDELGDVLFTVLQIANSAEIDATEALKGSLEKYEQRIAESGDPSHE